MTPEYSEFLKNRSVALVGGHDDINWKEVNRADVVVRINGHWARQGGRCNVVYFSCADDVDPGMFGAPELQKSLKWAWLNRTHTLFGANVGQFQTAQRLMPKSAKVGMFVQGPWQMWELFGALREMPEDQRWPERFSREYNGMHPLTGMIALYHLVMSQAWSIQVHGMTLYQGPDGEGFVVKAGTHHMAPQVAFLLDARKDPRVELRGRLNLLVNKYASEAVNFLAVTKV